MATTATIGHTPLHVGRHGQDAARRSRARLSPRTKPRVRAELRRQGVAPTRRQEAEHAVPQERQESTRRDIALFARQLATMLPAGIPMVQSFDIIGAGHEKPAMQKLMLAIKGDVEGGTVAARSARASIRCISTICS